MSEIPSARLTAECFGEQWGQTKDKIGYLTEMIIERDDAIREKCKEAITKLYGKRLSDMYSEALEDATNAIDSVFDEINKE